jgi:hypothetical protein
MAGLPLFGALGLKASDVPGPVRVSMGTGVAVPGPIRGWPSELRIDCDLEKVKRPRAIPKRILVLNVDLDFLLRKKSGFISGPLPNSEAKGWDLPLGVIG